MLYIMPSGESRKTKMREDDKYFDAENPRNESPHHNESPHITTKWRYTEKDESLLDTPITQGIRKK